MNTKATVGSLFRDHFESYNQRHPQPLFKLKAASAFMKCRTSAMGGHIQRCPNGHIQKAHYNSCKQRHCPACNALPSARWLEKQQAKILDCPHYHAVFTLPHYLLALWTCNPRLMADLLFSCAIATLRKLLDDPKYLGAKVGILAALHTWGRDQSRHPHVHLLITGGGIDAEGHWKAVDGDYLLPYQVVRKIFRAKTIDALNKAHDTGKLQLPPGLQSKDFDALMKKMATRVKWHTHFCAPYAHGKGVVSYLARYVKSGPFKNTQILYETKDTITFSYTDHREHGTKKCTLQHDEFLRRILWHIPEKRHQHIRYYGLYHSHKKTQRQQLRKQLKQCPETEIKRITLEEYLEQLGIPQVEHCPVCHTRLITSLLPVSAHQQDPPKGSKTINNYNPLTGESDE